MFGKEIVRLLWADCMEDSNTVHIVIADAETDAKEEREDKVEEDKKNNGNKEVPDTSLERKKWKRKNNKD